MECVIYFEDYKEDALSKLYTSAYEENTVSIKFSGGNGKLASEVERLISSNLNVFVVVVLDMVPENSDIVTVYNQLKMIGRIHPEFQGRYIIIPNVCAEYRFIKAFKELKFFQSQEDIALCMSKGDYKKSARLNQLFPDHRFSNASSVFPDNPDNRFLYSLGEIPVFFLKHLEKCSKLLYPTSKAISPIERSVSLR